MKNLLKKLFYLLIIFTLFILLRLNFSEIEFNPSNLAGEKIYNFHIISSLNYTKHFPPEDLWFAGYKLNYYYYSQYLIVYFSKLFFIEPESMINLAFCIYYTILVVVLYFSGFSILKNRGYALLFPLLVLFSWNFFPIKSFFINNNFSHLNFWDDSRIINGTINEFPFWNLLMGDFHAHGNSLLFLATIMVFYYFFFFQENNYQTLKGPKIILVSGLTGFLGGIATIINSWDTPLLLLFIIIFYLIFFTKKELPLSKKLILFLTASLTNLVALVLTSLLFKIHYIPAVSTISVIKIIQQTNCFELFTHFGFFFLLFLLYNFKLVRKNFNTPASQLFFLFFLFFPMIISLFLNLKALFLLAPIFLLLLFFLVTLKLDAENYFIISLQLIFFFLLIICEVIYIDDKFDGIYFRMNTVFKIYFQAWVIGGFCAALSISDILSDEKSIQKKLLIFIVACLIITTLIFSCFGLVNRFDYSRKNKKSLNGITYLQDVFPEKYACIKKLKEIKKISANLYIEASFWENAYSDKALIPTIMGYPMLLGWQNHISQHYAFLDKSREENVFQIIKNREKLLRMVYSCKNFKELQYLVKKLNISFIYIGISEKARYNTELEKVIPREKVVCAGEDFKLFFFEE